MDKIKLVVYNEYALGYIMPEQPDKVCTLIDRVTLGAPFRTMFEPYSSEKTIPSELAGRKDFDTYLAIVRGGTTIRRCTSMTPPDKNGSNQTIN